MQQVYIGTLVFHHIKSIEGLLKSVLIVCLVPACSLERETCLGNQLLELAFTRDLFLAVILSTLCKGVVSYSLHDLKPKVALLALVFIYRHLLSLSGSSE